MLDNCEHCNKRAELYHNDAYGLALCETCDLAADEQAEAPDPRPNVLLEREYAGIAVRLQHLPLMDLTGIEVEVNGVQQYRTVAPELALDAFNHPMIYLAPTQVAELGIR